MKSKRKRRILAVVLCMVIMLSNSSFIFASGGTEDGTAVSQEGGQQEVQTQAESTPSETEVSVQSETPQETETPDPEVTPTPEATPTPTAAPTPTEAPEPTEVPTPEASAAPTPAAEQDIDSEESAAVTPTPEAEPEPDDSSEEIVLEGSCGDTTVILSGPASSFPEETELSILVQEPAEEDAEVIKEAVEKQAEEQEMEVKSYTALDIRLLSNGEEIQPLGPVSVKFQQPEQQERTAEETSTQVLHVDESTGDATDMEAEVAEDGEVAIETTHFSIYVVVDLDQLGGEIELTVQHWATVEQLTGVDGQDGLVASDGGNGTTGDATASLRSENVFTKIYTDDSIKLDNQLKKKVEELSKVLLADANSTTKNYELTELWVLKEDQTAGTETLKTEVEINTEKEKWDVYILSDYTNNEKEISLDKNATVRMIYKPVAANDAF